MLNSVSVNHRTAVVGSDHHQPDNDNLKSSNIYEGVLAKQTI